MTRPIYYQRRRQTDGAGCGCLVLMFVVLALATLAGLAVRVWQSVF